jgi:hypothetical protein
MKSSESEFKFDELDVQFWKTLGRFFACLCLFAGLASLVEGCDRVTRPELVARAQEMLTLDKEFGFTTSKDQDELVVEVVAGPQLDQEFGLWKTVISLPRGYKEDSFRLVFASKEPSVVDGKMIVVQRWVQLSSRREVMFFVK